MTAPVPGTPLPWLLGNCDIYANGDKSSDYDDIVIAAIGQSGGFRSHEYAVARAHKPEGKANAAYIVHACNTLPEITAKAQRLADALEYLIPDCDAVGLKSPMLENARAAPAEWRQKP